MANPGWPDTLPFPFPDGGGRYQRALELAKQMRPFYEDQYYAGTPQTAYDWGYGWPDVSGGISGPISDVPPSTIGGMPVPIPPAGTAGTNPDMVNAFRRRATYEAPPVGMANMGSYGVGQLQRYGVGALGPYGRALRSDQSSWRR